MRVARLGISADGGGLADRPEDREEACAPRGRRELVCVCDWWRPTAEREEAGKEDDPVQDGEADHDTRSQVEQRLMKNW